MIRGLYTAVSGMISLEAKQQVITNNFANADTNGYKKDNLITKSFDEVMMINHDKKVNGKNVKNELGRLSNGSRIDEVYTDYEQGTLQETDRDEDFCIKGNGFFTLQDNNGNNFYSRDGKFYTNNQGFLVNSTGYKIMGKNITNGKLEPIKVGNSKIQCDNSGNIKLDGVNKYKFQIANFNRGEISKQGDNLYTSNAAPKNNDNADIRQGYIEKSNVNVINEMVDMMTTMRNFQSDQKVVQSMDDSLKKLIESVGNVR